jgi:hypothetical protein
MIAVAMSVRSHLPLLHLWKYHQGVNSSLQLPVHCDQLFLGSSRLCLWEIQAVVNSDPSVMECINEAIENQLANCLEGLEIGYTTCCNRTESQPEPTAFYPLPTIATLLAYECIDRSITGSTCDLFLAPLTNHFLQLGPTRPIWKIAIFLRPWTSAVPKNQLHRLAALIPET